MKRFALASFSFLGFLPSLQAQELASNMQPSPSAAPAANALARDAPSVEQLARAKALFDEGLARVREHEYAAARTAFEGAYRLAPRPAVLFNIARAAEALGDTAGGIAAYEAYLALTEAPNSGAEREERAEAALRLRTLKGAKGEPPPVSGRVVNETPVLVRVHCPWPGFALVQDGRVVAITPTEGTLSMTLGRPVEVRRPGYVTQKADIPGEGARVRCKPQLDLAATVPRSELHLASAAPNTHFMVDGASVSEWVRLPEGPHLVQASASGRGVLTRTVQLERGEARTLTLTPVPLDEVVTSPDPQRWMGVSLAALGAVALGASAAFFVDNEARFGRFQTEAKEVQALPPSDPTYLSRAQAANALLDQVETLDTVTWAVAASGGALVAAGVVVFFWPRSQARVQPGGLSLHANF